MPPTSSNPQLARRDWLSACGASAGIVFLADTVSAQPPRAQVADRTSRVKIASLRAIPIGPKVYVKIRTCTLLVALLLVSIGHAAQPLELPSTQRQLFVDDHLIETIDGLTRVVHQATRHPENPILRREKPWEQFRVMVYGTVIYDEDEKLFRMWYTVMPHDNTQPAVTINGKNRVPWVTLMAYATSEDGVHWNRPILEQLDFNGNGKQNNLVAVGRDNVEGFAVIKDVEEPNPERRYKAFFWEHRSFRADQYGVPPYDDPAVGDWNQGMWVAFSPDGIHWENHGRVIADASDTHQTVVHDPATGKFVCFNRMGGGGRRIMRTESDGLLQWGKPELVFQADQRDPPKTQVYGMTVTPYEGLYIGLPWMFYDDGVIDIRLATSRDGGRTWQRPGNFPQLIPTGAEGEWDAADFRMGNSVVVKDETIYLYYCAAPGGHPTGDVVKKIDAFTHEDHQKYRSMHVGLATLRRDGWVSLDAGEQPGGVITKPFKLPLGDLVVNVDASDGEISVDFLDETGKPLAMSMPLTGDQLRGQFRCEDMLPEVGQTVKLRFQLRNARLYSFWFAPSGDNRQSHSTLKPTSVSEPNKSLPGLREALNRQVVKGEKVIVEGPPSSDRDGDQVDNSVESGERMVGPRRALPEGVYQTLCKSWIAAQAGQDLSGVAKQVRQRYEELILSHMPSLRLQRIDVQPQTWIYPAGYDSNDEQVTVHARRLTIHAVDQFGDARALVAYFANYDKVDLEHPAVVFQINGHFGRNPSRLGFGLKQRGGKSGAALGKWAMRGLPLITYDDHDVGESSAATGKENGLHRMLGNLRMIDDALLVHFDRVDGVGLSGGCERLFHFLVFHRCPLKSAYLAGYFHAPWTRMDSRNRSGGPFGSDTDTHNDAFNSNFQWADLALVGIHDGIVVAFAHATFEGHIGKNCFFKETLPTLRRYTDRFQRRGDDPDGDGVSNNGRNLSHEYDLADYLEFLAASRG